MRIVKIAFISFICIVSTFSIALADKQLIRTGFWGGIDLGFGQLQQSIEDFNENNTNLFLGFKIGYTINQHFRMGFELSGWNIESADLEDPRKGEGISQVFLVCRYFPVNDLNWYIKFGGGYSSVWNNRLGQTDRSGGGLMVGGGYDYYIGKNFILNPFISYYNGEADDFKYDALTAGIGFLFD